MGKLYLGTDLAGLAEKLADSLAEAARQGDFFRPATIVVPNLVLKRWLRLYLARRLGIAINLRFAYLEDLFWEMLRELDPRPHPLPVERMPEDTYRLLILSILLDETPGGPALGPLRAYLGREGQTATREVCRRAWQLAVRLADLIRDYEFHRRDMVLRWLDEKDGGASADERTQCELFRLITREPDGLRAVLGRATNQVLKTLPQYAGEIVAMPPELRATPAPQTVHIFGIAQISGWHHLVLACLGERHDLRVYHPNPLVGRLGNLPADASEACALLQALCKTGEGAGESCALADELLAALGSAGAERLWLLAELLQGSHPSPLGGTGSGVKRLCSFQAEIIPAPRREPTVLGRLQDRLLGRPVRKPAVQDRTVQIVACPGIFREVETIYQSILHNLQEDQGLQQTDIAVLVADMPRYRAVFQAVFGRQPRRLAYNLADFTAAGLTAFGRGVLGLLDLALESFTRSRVFELLLNPCFLARLEVEREQALTWLEWADQLGVHHCWDRQDKQQRGYPDSPLYSWRLGLQRLRLGRLMDASADSSGLSNHYQEVIPFADLASGDKEQLDAFCRAVEGLLPRLARLRRLQAGGEKWAAELHRLIVDFLAVPPDRPEEQKSHDHVLAALPRLGILDQLKSGRVPALPLALVREFVLHNLEGLEGTSGEILSGGVTISSMPLLRALPFRIVYAAGLGEGHFPGSNALWSFDLRNREPRRGDVRPADANRFLLLEALLAAQEKLYLLYNNRELQRDQELHPAGPLNQVRRYLEQHILGGKTFQQVPVPLRTTDPRLLDPGEAGAYTDVLINYNETERLLALVEARENKQLQLHLWEPDELEKRLAQARRSLELPAEPVTHLAPPTIALRELKGYLSCPAEATLKRHLGLHDDDEPEPADDEPFSTDFPYDHRLIREVLERFILKAVEHSVDAALTGWRQDFVALHQEWRLRGRVPEDAFGEVDQIRFLHLVQERLEGGAGLGAFLRRLPAREGGRGEGAEFCGPILLGEHTAPIGPRTRFAALVLRLPAETVRAGQPPEVRITGVLPLAWRSPDAIEVLVVTGSSGRKVPADQLSQPMLEPLLFYLALKAGTEARMHCPASHEWLGDRCFNIHIAHGDGMARFTYTPEDFTSTEARDYLTQLVRDFFERTSLDMLPFDLLVADKDGDLRLPYVLPDGDPQLEELRPNYAALLSETVDDDLEKPERFADYRPMKLLEIAAARVPHEAFDLVRRRFHLLDRGPARGRSPGGGIRRGQD